MFYGSLRNGGDRGTSCPLIFLSDAAFSRFVSLFLPAPTSFLGTYLFYECGNQSGEPKLDTPENRDTLQPRDRKGVKLAAPETA